MSDTMRECEHWSMRTTPTLIQECPWCMSDTVLREMSDTEPATVGQRIGAVIFALVMLGMAVGVIVRLAR